MKSSLLVSSFLVLASFCLFACGQDQEVGVDKYTALSKPLSAVPMTIEGIDRPSFEAILHSLENDHAARTELRLESLPENERQAEEAQANSIGISMDKLQVSFSRLGTIRALAGWKLSIPTPTPRVGAESPEENARGFLNDHRALWGIQDPTTELELAKVSTRDSTQTKIIFDQKTRDGLPVFEHGILVQLNDSGNVIYLSGLLLPSVSVDYGSLVSSEEAISIGLAEVLTEDLIAEPKAELGIFNPEAFELEGSTPFVAWKVSLPTRTPHFWYFYIDASSGNVLHKNDELRRDYPWETWYESDPEEDDMGTLIYRSSPYYFYGSWPGDSHDGQYGNIRTRSYYSNRHSRDSWDDGQMGSGYHRQSVSTDTYTSETVWCPCDYTAWPSDTRCRAYINTNWACTDVIGHEITHGVSESEADFNSSGQPAALGESYSDVMSQFIEKYNHGGTDWEMGSNWCSYCSDCELVRKLYDPEDIYWLDDCPVYQICNAAVSHWNNYGAFGSTEHVNAGIADKVGWLNGREASEGYASFAGISVKGIGEYDAGRLWYKVLTTDLSYWSRFVDFRYHMINEAYSLFSSDWRASETKWALNAVGIWNYAQSQGLYTNSSLAFANFTVGSQWRKYVFYTKPYYSWGQLFYRYRTCSLQGTCSWSSEGYMDWAADKAPSAVVHDGKIWVFYKYDINNNIYYSTLNSSGTWSHHNSIDSNPQTDGNVSALVVDGDIWLFYKVAGSGDQMIRYTAYDTSSSDWWDTSMPVGDTSDEAYSDAGPSAIMADNDVYVFYNTPGSNNVSYHATSAFGWYNYGVIDAYGSSSFSGAVGSPAAAAHRDRLNVAARKSNNTTLYASKCLTDTSCTYHEGEWTQVVSQDDYSYGFVSLFKDIDGWLYRFFGGWDATVRPVYRVEKFSE